MRWAGRRRPRGAAPPPPAEGAGDPIRRLPPGRCPPRVAMGARVRLWSGFSLSLGGTRPSARPPAPADTPLARDQAPGSPEVRALLGSFAPHFVEQVASEASWDTRDDEIVTRHGNLHSVRVVVSPRVGNALPYGYQRLTGVVRFYRTPI